MGNEIFTSIAQAGNQEVIYGRSVVNPVEVGESEKAQEVQATLSRLQDIAVLLPHVVIEDTGIQHEMTGQSFIGVRSISRQFLHARAILPDTSGNYKYGNLATIDGLENRERVDIISGPCLFSGSTIHAVDAKGNVHYLGYPQAAAAIQEPIVDITVDPQMQPYEADSVLRLAKTIGLFNSDKATVNLNVPKVEYYFYVLDLLRKGLVDKAVAQKWFESVDARSKNLEAALAKRLPSAYQQEGKIKRMAPLEEVEAMVKTGVAQGDEDLFTTVVDHLQTSKLWRQLLKRGKPQTFTDLSRLSYVAAQLTLAQDRQSTVVAVENPEEAAILRETMHYIGGTIKGANIVGVFPHPRVVLRNNDQSVIDGRYLYFYTGDRKQAMQEIIAANK